MNRRLLFILLIISPALSYSQFNARYGYKYATTDVLRLFIVFADVIDDPYQGNVNNWQPGQLPLYADSIIDENYGGNLVSYMSRYYREASCGLINIIGDYYPNLVQFSYSEIESVGYKQVADYLNSLSGNDITTAHGYHLSDFDQWSYGLTQRRNYRIKQNSPDNKMDMLIIIWRRNSKFKPNRDGGQSGTPKAIDTLCIKCLSGINGYAAICGNDIGDVMRHEFGHSLVGDNSYHSGGAGAGASGHFLPNVGGYSIISSHNRNLDFCNGWDRWWLGWKHPNKNYYISATDLLGDEVETDMVYGENLSTNDFILRDFATYGDAIRIKLPHLRHFNGQVRNQYLWIENHQITPGSVEYDATRPQDIRFNIQVGNDDLEQGFENSRTNYIVPLSAFGNYDFYFDTLPYDGSDPMDFTKRYVAIAYDSTANPFTGYHPAMMPAIDYNNNDTIQAKEHVVIRRLYRNGDLEIDKHTVYGNDYDAFHAGSKLSMSTNPPSTPLMTFRTEERPKGNELGSAFAAHEYDDNRYIWLNGLSVEIAEKYANGDIRVHIAWDDFKIRSDARWCGPIMLTETAELEQGLTLTLDHGLTPTRPCEPSTIMGAKVFADPTTLTCLGGSIFRQELSSTVNVDYYSTLVLDQGSLYEIRDGATLNIYKTGSLHIKSGATLRVLGSGRVEVHYGGNICIEDGANIELLDDQSVVNLHTGYQQGRPDTGLYYTCTATPLTEYALSEGSHGRIQDFMEDRYIQDTVYYGNALERGLKIAAGRDITPNKPVGDVILESGSNVIMYAEKKVRLERGFAVKLGAVLRVRRGL